MTLSGTYSKILRFYWLAPRLFLKKYWPKAHLTLSNSFDLVTFSYLLNALKLPLGKGETVIQCCDITTEGRQRRSGDILEYRYESIWR